MGYCCVPCCKLTQGKGLSFHKFPTSIESKRKWIVAISRQGNPRGCNWTPKGRSTVCSKHFIDSDYSISTTKKILLPNAVPSVFKDLVARKKRGRPAKLRTESTHTKKRKSSATSQFIMSTSEESSKVDSDHITKTGKASRKRRIVVSNTETEKHRLSKVLKTIQEKSTLLCREDEGSESDASITSEALEKISVSNSEGTIEHLTRPIAEETSETDSECDVSRSSSVMNLNISPHSTTIKISKNLQSILRKLVTTIEDQRAEISRLKRERDLLSQQLCDLKNSSKSAFSVSASKVHLEG